MSGRRTRQSDKAKDARLRRLFGISLAIYHRMFSQQHGSCAICQAQPKKQALAVDHDHATGFVRGLLCNRCNRALAAFRDNPALMRRSADYLAEAAETWDSMTPEEQEVWLPFRGRSNGKGRRARITKSRRSP